MGNNIFILLKELKEQAQTTDHITFTQFQRKKTDKPIDQANYRARKSDDKNLIAAHKHAVDYHTDILRQYISTKTSVGLGLN